MRSELAVTAAVSLANAVSRLGQQVGLATNARDAADRLRVKKKGSLQFETRSAARGEVEEIGDNDRLKPLQVPTRRGVEQFHQIREMLARVELSDGLAFPQFVLEIMPRLPRDATVIAILGDANIEVAVALNTLLRQGFAVSVVMITLEPGKFEKAYGQLLSQGLRDLRHLPSERELSDLCSQSMHRGNPYSMIME